MYRRKIEDELLSWKQRPNHKPLVVRGVRQCGKSTSVRLFAESNYENVVYIDFHERDEMISLFNGQLSVDYLTAILSAAIPNARFVPYKTCLIFDEIQECPRARGALKFFKEDGRYDVICTGSLLGVRGYRPSDQNASIPVGSEEFIKMYPMDFEEWLWANGINEKVLEMLKQHLSSEEAIPEALHVTMRRLLLEYIVVGGMPEAVKCFIETHDVNQTVAVQSGIVEEYRADMIKYAPAEHQSYICQCFDSIPKQLARENKKFQYSVVRKGGRSSQFAGSLQWIEDAGIINRCYNLNITELPLDGNANDSEFKVYMEDSGLFMSMLEPGTQADILKGNMLSYKGAVFENFIAGVFSKMGRKLYYFRKDSGLELDFVIRYKGECTPVECKATTGKAQSLRTVLGNRDKYHVIGALKLGDYNIGRNESVLTLPMYMAFLLTDL